jgi:hypothetical protein
MLESISGNPFLAVQVIDGLVRARSLGRSESELPMEFITGVWLDDRNKIEAILPSMIEAQLWQDFGLCRLSSVETGAASLSQLGATTGNRVHIREAARLFAAVALIHGETEKSRARLAEPAGSGPPGEEDDLVPGIRLVRGWLEVAEGTWPRPYEYSARHSGSPAKPAATGPGDPAGCAY